MTTAVSIICECLYESHIGDAESDYVEFNIAYGMTWNDFQAGS